LSLEALAVESFVPEGEEPQQPASTTYEASLWYCASTGGPYLCLAYCEGDSRAVC
jgi:hypothetical protein